MMAHISNSIIQEAEAGGSLKLYEWRGHSVRCQCRYNRDNQNTRGEKRILPVPSFVPVHEWKTK